MDKNNKNTLTYKIGQAIALVLSACVATVIIALTIKCIMWIF